MVAPLKLDALETLPRTRASDVKTLGWRGVMKSVARGGPVLVTNHDEPEAVILSADDYASLMNALNERPGKASALETLRRDFDRRLASLQAADTGERLRGVMRGTAKLHGKVKAGSSY